MNFDNIEPKEVPAKLSDKILNNSSRHIEPSITKVLIKYLGIFTISIFFSLIVCPQNGVGLLRTNFPIYHSFFHNNLLLCGLYCGFMFFITTHLVSFYLLNHFERIVIFKKMGYLPAICLSTFFAFSMTPFFTIVDFSLLYTIGWLGIAVLLMIFHKKMFMAKVSNYSF